MKALITIFAWVVAPAWGTTFYVKPFPESVRGASAIVRVEAVSSQGRWATQSGRRQIYTYTKVKVIKVYKGDIKESEIDVRQPGGEVEGVGLQVPGTSKFNTGDEVVLLLNRQNSDGSYDVKGLMLGRLEIQTNSEGEEVLSGPALQWQDQVTTGHDEKTSHDQEHDDTGGFKKDWAIKDLVELINTQNKNKNASSPTQANPKEPQSENKQKSNLNENSAPPLQKQEGGGSMEEFSHKSQNQSEEESHSSLWPLWTLFFVSIFVVLFVLKR